MTITSVNAHEAGAYVRLAKKLGASLAAMIPMIPSRGSDPLLIPSRSQVLKAIGDAEDAAEKLKFLASLWCSPFATSLVRSKYVSVGECPPDSMDIEPGGKVLLCDTLDFVVADTRKDGLIKAWGKSLEKTQNQRCTFQLPLLSL